MSNFLAFVGASVGGWAGWAVGAPLGIMSAWTLSVVGMAVGVYAGRRAAAALLD
jgi:hypothetical protein